MTPSPAFIFKKEWKQVKNLIERIEARLDDWGAKLEKKNIEYPVDLICGILFLVIGIVLLLIMPRQVQISEKDVVNGRAFPTMLIWLMLAMSALLVVDILYLMSSSFSLFKIPVSRLLCTSREQIGRAHV